LKSGLVFVPGKTTIDSASYVQTVLKSHLIPFWYKYCEKYGWARVVKDNAPSHKGYDNYYREINDIDNIQWPAQLPDLKVIEAL
jgi:hypothetical protein